MPKDNASQLTAFIEETIHSNKPSAQKVTAIMNRARQLNVEISRQEVQKMVKAVDSLNPKNIFKGKEWKIG